MAIVTPNIYSTLQRQSGMDGSYWPHWDAGKKKRFAALTSIVFGTSESFTVPMHGEGMLNFG